MNDIIMGFSSTCTFRNLRTDSINMTTLEALFIELDRITRGPYTEHTLSGLSGLLEVYSQRKNCSGFLLMKETSTKNIYSV